MLVLGIGVKIPVHSLQKQRVGTEVQGCALESKLQAPLWQDDVVVKCSNSPKHLLREKANKMPDLIDTRDSDDGLEVKNSVKTHGDQRIANPSPSAALLIDDLFGDSLEDGESTNPQKIDDDPFADVSFHASNGNEHASDMFSGITVDTEAHVTADKTGPEPFDFFQSKF
ncbi:unnamed protein product [Fraxinus pennsylvanica]|uniref:Uncharacterized protein n=1 Tax=Fraxinus pennsylvanica TaxID=56036 RepID=A0AAD1YM41_9LAMI|nr:unnamed protein product [Fraxinus pennsylvanica]